MNERRKTLVLTGASRGIGHATVKKFSENGWRIITCSREDVPDECRRDPNWAEQIEKSSRMDKLGAHLGHWIHYNVRFRTCLLKQYV